MPNTTAYTFIQITSALVWLINGAYCKVLNRVPRHALIVGRILGDEKAGLMTKLIGWSEIAMAIWIASDWFSTWNAIAQMTIVATMNIIEFFLAPDLLLWGRWNAFFALIFILVIYTQHFLLA